MSRNAALATALSASVCLLTFGVAAAQDVARLAVLRVPAAELRRLESELLLDVAAARRDGAFEIVAHDAQLAALAARGVPFEIAVPDLKAHYASRLAPAVPLAPGQQGAVTLVPPFGAGSMGGYWTWAEVVSVMDQLAAAYPAIISPKQSIGTTLEGRTIWAFKVSDNPLVDEPEPEARLDAMHHAREPEGMQALLWYVMWLADNHGSDPLATYLVNSRELWCVPVVNPDGYVHNQSTDPDGGGLWRKNRRNNGDGSFGVDINRNYPSFWGWDNEGSSSTKSSETYRGTTPASEPETAAMVAFMSARDFRTALSLHTYGDVWLSPYGYEEQYPENVAQYDEIATLATELNGFPAGPASVLLYLANGVTADHDHAAHGTLCWSPELGDDSDGFWPPSDRIVPIAEQNLQGLQRTVLAAGAWARIASLAATDAGNDGLFDPGEEVEIVLTLRNSGTLATATNVTALLTTSTPGISVLDGAHDFGALAAFSSADNAAAPMRLGTPASLPAGAVVSWTVELGYEGWTQTVSGSVQLGKRHPFLIDDVETDFGWTAGVAGDDASTGKWTRGAPVGTTNNGLPLAPGSDATSAPGTLAFVTGNGGGSAGTDDVDNGKTTLLSPVFDLSSVGPAVLSYARWYADATVQDDDFAVSLSNDGGSSWVPLETLGNNAAAWTRPEFQLTTFLPQTDRMRLRFVASDSPNNSLVEAGVDDLQVDVYDSAPRINLYGPQTQGSNLALNLAGQPGDAFTWFASPATGFVQLGSVSGPLLLDPGSLFPLFGGSVPAGGLSKIVAAVPVNPALTSVTVYFQALVLRAGKKHLSNRETLALP